MDTKYPLTQQLRGQQSREKVVVASVMQPTVEYCDWPNYPVTFSGVRLNTEQSQLVILHEPSHSVGIGLQGA
jgi:hypothetical protein